MDNRFQNQSQSHHENLQKEQLLQPKDIRPLFELYSDQQTHEMTILHLQKFLHQEQNIKLTFQQISDLLELENQNITFEQFEQFLFLNSNQLDYQQENLQQNSCITNFFIKSSKATFYVDYPIQMAQHFKCDIDLVPLYIVLQNNTRYIELEIWDGDSESQQPYILGGVMQQNQILLDKVLLTLKENCFKTSKTPFFIYIEDHCTKQYQSICVDLFEKYLGNVIYEVNIHQMIEETQLPNMKELMNKIILFGNVQLFKPKKGKCIDTTQQSYVMSEKIGTLDFSKDLNLLRLNKYQMPFKKNIADINKNSKNQLKIDNCQNINTSRPSSVSTVSSDANFKLEWLNACGIKKFFSFVQNSQYQNTVNYTIYNIEYRNLYKNYISNSQNISGSPRLSQISGFYNIILVQKHLYKFNQPGQIVERNNNDIMRALNKGIQFIMIYQQSLDIWLMIYHSLFKHSSGMILNRKFDIDEIKEGKKSKINLTILSGRNLLINQIHNHSSTNCGEQIVNSIVQLIIIEQQNEEEPKIRTFTSNLVPNTNNPIYNFRVEFEYVHCQFQTLCLIVYNDNMENLIGWNSFQISTLNQGYRCVDLMDKRIVFKLKSTLLVKCELL